MSAVVWKQGTQNRYDWDAIRLEYLAGYSVTDPETGVKSHRYPTHQDLSDKYGCSVQVVRVRSHKEGWGTSRKVFQAKFREKATQAQVKGLLSESTLFDAQTIDKLKKLYRLVDAYLNQYTNVIDDEDSDFSFDNLPEGISPPSIKELSDLTKLLETCQRLIRVTVGEPIHNDKQFTEIMDEINIASKDHANNVMDAEEKIEKLSQKRQSYKQATASLQKEIKRLREEVDV